MKLSCRGEQGWFSYEVRTTAETSMVKYGRDGTVTHGANLHPEPDHPEIAAEAEANCRRDAESGDAEAMFQLAIKLAERGALTEAQQWFRACAETGHATAAESVGWILERNGSHTEAANWYRKAADLGSTRAAEYLAQRASDEDSR
ncbi:sel1 repeat family protein [Streptomyces lunaelactis]|uniref:sel1 repeat family protein n=1 Tax=Streptomyces lunaelactis TaxID=1535768 RepID=UPI001584A9F0|nr:sel1 repeat family protein [Streptomyces lunaelactis]NUL04762.1 sel1 repeat family protein [Streptomyces lunaelactis]